MAIIYNYISGGGDGTSGNDYYYNTPGAVPMSGGFGDDVYTVDNSGDTVTESLNGGNDTVISSISYTLAPNVENLELAMAGLVGTGNDLDNVMVGTSGSDTFIGGLGDDIYYADHNDTIIEFDGEGTDTIVTSKGFSLAYKGLDFVENVYLSGNAAVGAIGNDGVNYLHGNSANNFINGKGGADIMDGASGNDLYIVDNVGDRITETGISSLYNNNDTLWASVSYDMSTNATHVEIAGLYGGSGLTITGNDLDNTYYIDNDTYQVVEAASGGNDTVVSSVSFALGANVDNLTLTVAGLTGTGNGDANVIRGTSGSDTLAGGGGNDTYYADHNDTIIEFDGEGTDTIVTSKGFSLTYKGYDFVENVHLSGSAAVNAIGNDGNNVLTGNSANNFINGKGGDDRLEGGYGNDVLFGGDSVGSYVGMDGADTFVFNTILNRGNVDTILDFNSATGDTIELSTTIFSGIASGSTTAMSDGYIIQNSGSLYYDADAGGSGSAVMFAQLTNGAVLSDSDFSVV